MTKNDLNRLAFPLGQHVPFYTDSLADKGYELCKVYQGNVLSFSENITQLENVSRFWKECAMEHCAGTWRARLKKAHPDETFIYKSDYLEQLRKKAASSDHSSELEPTIDKHDFCDDKTRTLLLEKILQKRQEEVGKLGIKGIPNFHHADFEEKTELFYSEFINLGDQLGYKFDQKRSSKSFPVLVLDKIHPEVDICCYIETIFTRYEVRNVSVGMVLISKEETRKLARLFKIFRSTTPTPAFIEINGIFLAPGFNCYSRSSDSISHELLSARVGLELFKLVSSKLA